MSDQMPEEEARTDLRRRIVELCAEYGRSWMSTEDAVLTGYIAAMEVSNIHGDRWIVWITGNGDDTTDGAKRGLASWRVEGIVRYVLRDIDSGDVARGGD